MNSDKVGVLEASLSHTPNTITQNAGSFRSVCGDRRLEFWLEAPDTVAHGSEPVRLSPGPGRQGGLEAGSRKKLAPHRIIGVTVSKALNVSEPQFPHQLGSSLDVASSE